MHITSTFRLPDLAVKTLSILTIVLAGILQSQVCNSQVSAEISDSGKVVSIIGAGDVMPGTNYPKPSYLPRSCSSLFDPVRDIISSADMAFCNIEGVFADRGGTAKTCRDTTNCYIFRMPDSYASCIIDAGFDVFGLANNHVNDFGAEGRDNTIRLLKEKAIPFAGFPSHPYIIYEANGLKIGFCAFAPHTACLDMKDYARAAALVAKLDTLCDIVVVSFHGGAEGKDHQHVTRTDEEFLGYNRGSVYKFAHTVIDAGADLVVGHGPHVVRAIEFYNGKLIAYSLGNFCTYRRFNLSGPNANAPLLQVWLDSNGNYVKGRIHSFYQPGEGGPVPDPGKKAISTIRELSRQDFPEKQIEIDDDGWIISINP